MPLLQELRSIVCPTQWVDHSMGELMFNDVGSESQFLVEQGACYGAEAMARHLLLRNLESPHGHENCILTHRSTAATSARENKSAPAREFPQFL